MAPRLIISSTGAWFLCDREREVFFDGILGNTMTHNTQAHNTNLLDGIQQDVSLIEAQQRLNSISINEFSSDWVVSKVAFVYTLINAAFTNNLTTFTELLILYSFPGHNCEWCADSKFRSDRAWLAAPIPGRGF